MFQQKLVILKPKYHSVKFSLTWWKKQSDRFLMATLSHTGPKFYVCDGVTAEREAKEPLRAQLNFSVF